MDINVPLLHLRGMSKSSGPLQALTDVDLDVPAGRITALCGDNGAGKSVLIKWVWADLLGRAAGAHPQGA